MRKARQITGALLGMGLIVSLGLAVPAAASASSQGAQAAGIPLSASPDVTEGTIHLTGADAYGWTTQGDNAQLTIQSSGQTLFYRTSTSDPGFFKIHVANSSHCVEGIDSSGEVIATDCQQGNHNQEWKAFSYRGGCTLQTRTNSELATVYNDVNGKPVWMHAGIQPGTWQAWTSTIFPC